jgi:tetratricopeptide (TPR) repeat protein
VHSSLTELAAELTLQPGVDRPQAALDVLADNNTQIRWLLIYDNVDDVDVLDGLLPASGTGHIIITTRMPAESTSEVSAFRSNDSVELLRDQVPDLSEGDAEKVAELVEHLPLGLRLAAAWMRESATVMRRQVPTRAGAAEWSATEFQVRMDRQLVQQPADRSPEDAPVSLAAALGVVAEILRESDIGCVILRLAQLCAFLSADGVALRLVRSRAMLEALAPAVDDGDGLLVDPLELDRVLQSGSRSGLFDVLWEHPSSLRMHRVVQALVQGGMTPEEHQKRHQEVLHGLAAFAPTDPEATSAQDALDFAELLKHLEPSRAAASSHILVRRWIVDHMGHLHRKGDPEAWRFAVKLSQRALAGWEPRAQAEISLRMRLQFHLTNLQRELGQDPNDNLAQDQALLEKQREVLGPKHPRTLKTGRSTGASLRSLGRFAEACREEYSTLQGFREVLGDDHPDTLRAKNNLAASYFLAGDVPSALMLEQENRAHRLALFGPDHPDVWWSACNVGTCLRELGKYEEALKVLNDTLAHIVHIRPDRHPDVLRIQWNRAIVMRRSGDVAGAFEHNTETLRDYRALYGDDHPRTWVCELSFALDHHQIGDSATAVRLAEDCLQDHVGLGEDHPFTALCRANLAIFLRSLGDVERAFELGGRSRRDLHNRLGEEHPWALAATINHAHGVAQVQDRKSGTELLRSVYDMCREFLVRDHPYTLLAAKNLINSIDQWGDIGVDLVDVP